MNMQQPITNLEKYVQLWIEADFLQMPELLAITLHHILAKLHDAAHNLTTFEPPKTGAERVGTIVHSWTKDRANFALFLADLGKAASLAYEVPAARVLQLQFTVCVASIHEYFEAEQYEHLTTACPKLGTDIVSLLVSMHFHRDHKHWAMTPLGHRVVGASRSEVRNKCCICDHMMGNTQTLHALSCGSLSWYAGCGRRSVEESAVLIVDEILEVERKATLLTLDVSPIKPRPWIRIGTRLCQAAPHPLHFNTTYPMRENGP